MSIAPSFVPTIPLGEVEPHVAVEQIVRQAIQMQASDLFILSDENSTGISLRLVGLIEPVNVVPREQGRHLINFFKTTAGMFTRSVVSTKNGYVKSAASEPMLDNEYSR